MYTESITLVPISLYSEATVLVKCEQRTVLETCTALRIELAALEGEELREQDAYKQALQILDKMHPQ